MGRKGLDRDGGTGINKGSKYEETELSERRRASGASKKRRATYYF